MRLGRLLGFSDHINSYLLTSIRLYLEKLTQPWSMMPSQDNLHHDKSHTKYHQTNYKTNIGPSLASFLNPCLFIIYWWVFQWIFQCVLGITLFRIIASSQTAHIKYGVTSSKLFLLQNTVTACNFRHKPNNLIQLCEHPCGQLSNFDSFYLLISFIERIRFHKPDWNLIKTLCVTKNVARSWCC